MLESKSEQLSYLSCLAFTLGVAIGFGTVALCSFAAREKVGYAMFFWYEENCVYPCFVADLLFVSLCLFFSTSVLGYLFIPILDSLLGFFLALLSYTAFRMTSCFSYQVIVMIPSLLAILPILRVSSLGIQISLRVARLWRSDGIRSFDLHPLLCSLWGSLLVLYLLLPLRAILSAFLF